MIGVLTLLVGFYFVMMGRIMGGLSGMLGRARATSDACGEFVSSVEGKFVYLMSALEGVGNEKVEDGKAKVEMSRKMDDVRRRMKLSVDADKVKAERMKKACGEVEELLGELRSLEMGVTLVLFPVIVYLLLLMTVYSGEVLWEINMALVNVVVGWGIFVIAAVFVGWLLVGMSRVSDIAVAVVADVDLRMEWYMDDVFATGIGWCDRELDRRIGEVQVRAWVKEVS